jgi:hypothetical protein
VAPDSVWEIVFLMVILKIPIVYLCWVVWWAVRSKPLPEEGASVHAVVGDPPPELGSRRAVRHSRRPRPRPHGGPARTYPRTAHAAASARGRVDR